MSEEKSVDEYAARISADFKIKECPAFLGGGGTILLECARACP
jgi:hypothetical protein